LDTPRHRLHLNLPVDYPRLNMWPEWFVIDGVGQYRVEDASGQVAGQYEADRLIGAGLDVQLKAGSERELRICPGAG
jgi:hypothetical protein